MHYYYDQNDHTEIYHGVKHSELGTKNFLSLQKLLKTTIEESTDKKMLLSRLELVVKWYLALYGNKNEKDTLTELLNKINIFNRHANQSQARAILNIVNEARRIDSTSTDQIVADVIKIAQTLSRVSSTLCWLLRAAANFDGSVLGDIPATEDNYFLFNRK
jgi:hypothetical protein